jgi:hypothetical protein
VTATILQFPARKPNRPARWAELDAIFEEESARRGLITETAATLAKDGYTSGLAAALGAELGFEPATASALEAAMTDAGVAAILEASSRP